MEWIAIVHRMHLRRTAFVLAVFLCGASCAITTSLLVALDAAAPDSQSRALAILVRNDFAQPGVVLEWPADPPVPSMWKAPGQVAEVRGFAILQIDAHSQSETVCQMEVTRLGWPIPVLEQLRLWWPWDDPAFQTTHPTDSGLRPIWSGLLLHGMTAGAVGAGCVALVFWLHALRVRLRSRRGACPSCGHTLAGLSQCPECGAVAAVPVKNTASDARPDSGHGASESA